MHKDDMILISQKVNEQIYQNEAAVFLQSNKTLDPTAPPALATEPQSDDALHGSGVKDFDKRQ